MTRSTLVLATVTALAAMACNAPPEGGAVEIRPEAPTTTDPIRAELTEGAIDRNGDDITYVWTWTVDGSPSDVTEPTVDSALTTKGEVWQVTVVARDDELESEDSATAEVTVVNTPPAAAGAELTLAELTEASVVGCQSTGWIDPDLDAESYERTWIIDGIELSVSDETLTGAAFDKGGEVTCRLTPHDGDEAGEPVTAPPLIVQNTPPILAGGSFEPEFPSTDDDLRVITGEITDIDGDDVTIEYQWFVDGFEVWDDEVLPAEFTARNQEVVARLTPYDDEQAGEPVEVGPLFIGNTPPAVVEVTFTPEDLRTNDVLSMSVGTFDPDGDVPNLEVQWFVDGVPSGVGGLSLEGALYFDKGEAVSAEVTPSDDESVGEVFVTDEIVVGNTAPGAPDVVIAPINAAIDDSLQCLIAADAPDPDADPLTYRATWTRDGVTYRGTSTTVFSGDTVPANVVEAYEEWTCSVTANDGTEVGPAGTDTVEILDWMGERVLTACAATGASGPTQAQCNSAYGTTNLAGEITVTSGRQAWRAPVSGTYRITALGAQGASAATGFAGGKGARMRGDFSLSAGDTLTMVVGQVGTSDGCSAGGGGGTFVFRGTSLLLAAGGGGGMRQSASQNGCDGRISDRGGVGSGGSPTSSCAVKAVGTAGDGGIVSSSSWGSGGGAIGNDGVGEYTTDNGGKAYINGSTGGGNTSYTAYGGFGGGGSGNGGCGGGGGGGFSGGDGGWVAGGGGSDNRGATQSNAAGVRSGPGQVLIDLY